MITGCFLIKKQLVVFKVIELEHSQLVRQNTI